MDWGKKWLVDFSARKTRLVSFNWSNNNGSIDVTMALLLRKTHFLLKLLCISINLYTICPCMEYCCPVWDGASSYYFELLGKLQNQICRTVALLPLLNPWLIVKLWPA